MVSLSRLHANHNDTSYQELTLLVLAPLGSAHQLVFFGILRIVMVEILTVPPSLALSLSATASLRLYGIFSQEIS
jgi:hypothetical protein